MRFYFLGIAGTAMASLAAMLKQKGHDVWGTDQGIYPPMSDFLQQQHIPVWQGYDVAHLDTPFDVAVIGNALTRGNPEVEEILNRRLPIACMPRLIREHIIQNRKSIVITGTHGKTTTSALMTWILDVAGKDPGFLVGGIPHNFGYSARYRDSEFVVLEGDEYDSAFFDKRPKFLHYFPFYLIINNIEFDHADIYRDVVEIQDNFRKLLRIMPSRGLVVANGDSENVRAVLDPIYSRLQTFGQSDQNDWYFRILSADENGSHFQVYYRKQVWGEFTIHLPGEFQIRNALACIAMAAEVGIPRDAIGKALETFRGVKRRMDVWGNFHNALVIDDFAHHPTAIRETLEALRRKYHPRRLVALFEPRTNTTVRNIFQTELAEALSHADAVLVAPLHRPERFPPEERLSLSQLQNDLTQLGKTTIIIEDYQHILPVLEDTLRSGDLLVILTNGNLGGVYSRLKEMVIPPNRGSIKPK
ncbi:MAG: UDP-N-acetylmuramate:L-alanyl-gamma-D-glutamyl-meso-diaminopimelate ligase [Calditrichaeota bacterium]|nr:UDP-N-acetylmuramate:L-alanyl-gamma-D-glutamyl-meso-diaminopimelate ligase [Calditrichota bacterium]